MGSKQKRENLAKGLVFRNGKLIPMSDIPLPNSKPLYKERILTCRVCNENVPENNAVSHVQSCWGISYPTIGAIPNTPPPEAFHNHKKAREAAISKPASREGNNKEENNVN